MSLTIDEKTTRLKAGLFKADRDAETQFNLAGQFTAPTVAAVMAANVKGKFLPVENHSTLTTGHPTTQSTVLSGWLLIT